MDGTVVQRLRADLDRVRDAIKTALPIVQAIEDGEGAKAVLDETRTVDVYRELLEGLSSSEAALAQLRYLLDARTNRLITSGAAVCDGGNLVARWSALANATVAITPAPSFVELNDGVPESIRVAKTKYLESVLLKTFDRSSLAFVEDEPSRQSHMGFTSTWFLWSWSTLLADREHAGEPNRALLVTTPQRAQRLCQTFVPFVHAARLEIADLFTMTPPLRLDPNIPRFIVASPEHIHAIDLRQIRYCAWDAPLPDTFNDLPWTKLTALVVRGPRELAAKVQSVVKEPVVTCRLWMTTRRLSVSQHSDSASMMNAVQDALRTSSEAVTVFTQTPSTFFYGSIVAHSYTDALPSNMRDVIAVDPPEYVVEWASRVACESLIIFTSRDDIAQRLQASREVPYAASPSSALGSREASLAVPLAYLA